jgi:hypothetical protein
MIKRCCIDCRHKWTPPTTGPWLDPMICPGCGSDETVGEPPSLEDELAALAGEIAFDRALGNGRR